MLKEEEQNIQPFKPSALQSFFFFFFNGIGFVVCFLFVFTFFTTKILPSLHSAWDLVGFVSQA